MQSKQRASGRTVSAEQAVVLENIEHTTHLAEDEDTRALRLHVLEQLVENDHLSSIFTVIQSIENPALKSRASH